MVAFATDTGKELWRTPLPDLKERVNKKPTGDVRALPKGLRLPPRFSAALSAGLVCASMSDWGTVALDPKDGKVVWSKPDLAISNRSRIASRNGTLLVCALDGDVGLDARTGELLWKNPPKNIYAHALSDLFLESKGTKDLHLSGRCWQPILANGVWYSHFPASSNNRMQATVNGKVVWSFDFLSNACPTPSPAYGRLYYSPAGEGVVYCFVPAKE
jgi:outer membrane protein assembly factor BamB